MNCKKVQKYLYLYRSGELNSQESEQLKAHLSTCSSCERKMQTVQKTNLILKTLQKELHDHPEPRDLTNKIMSRIHGLDNIPLKNHTKNLQEIFGYILYNLKMEHALTPISIVLVVLFLAQQSFVFNRVKILEEKMERGVTITSVITSHYLIDIDQLSDTNRGLVNEIMSNLTFKGTKRVDGTILINKSLIPRLRKKQSHMFSMFNLMVKKSQNRYPGFKKMKKSFLSKKWGEIKPNVRLRFNFRRHND